MLYYQFITLNFVLERFLNKRSVFCHYPDSLSRDSSKGFIQDIKVQRGMEAVRDLTSQYAKVPRGGKQQVIEGESLAVEGIVILKFAGKFLPI